MPRSKTSREAGSIVELPELRDRTQVFENRKHAGSVLAGLLAHYAETQSVVLGIPAGGVPVASVVAARLSLPLDVAVVSKITLPWDTEAGYGAVGFDGTVRLNEALIAQVGLSRQQINEGIAGTTQKVQRRVQRLRGQREFPGLSRGPVILVDDGLASGFTMRVAVKSLKNRGVVDIVVAVPTGHAQSVKRLTFIVSSVYCPNIRGGGRFAVADAYVRWSDVDEETVARMLRSEDASS